MKREIINARGLTIRTENGLLVYNGSFSVYEGEILAFCQTSQIPFFLLALLENPGLQYDGYISFLGNPVSRSNPIDYTLVAGRNVLFDTLSITDNLYAFAGKPSGLLYNHRKAKIVTKGIMEAMHMPFDSSIPIEDLTISQKYMLELAKALLRNSKIIVMDNITQHCNTDDFAWIISMLKVYSQKGRTFILLSNEDNRLISECQRVYFVRGNSIADLSFQDEYTHDMFDRILYGVHTEFYRKNMNIHMATEVPAIEINLAPELHVSEPLCVYPCEIFGIFDTYGALTRVVYDTFLNDFPYAVAGKKCNSYEDAVHKGLAVVSIHRQNTLFETFTLEENLIFPALKRISRFGVINFRLYEHCLNRYMPLLQRRCDTAETELEQFKLLMYRWMLANPNVIVVEDPPLDLEAGQQRVLQAFLRDIADSGCCVILISPNANIGLKYCDRALILQKDGAHMKVGS